MFGVTADIAIGTLPAWLTFAGVIAAAWVFYRGGGGTALQSLTLANSVLEKRVHDLTEENKSQAAQIAELRGRTDVALALRPVLDAVTNHETQATARAERMLVVLDLIAKRLGPDDGTEQT